MPTINKIRIVNFAYNKDNRIIPDTTFDFKSQDGLITLRNGGGKSIMAQIIMQPIVPMCSLGNNAKKRTFDNIFRKDKEPSYILIEWKLDNNKGVMTNGIAFKRFTSSEEEERENNIDYYTFILDRAQCDLNITNLKLSSFDGNVIKIKDYYEVKDYIDKRGGRVYKSESEAYRNNLMMYNIFPKEWKSIIAKINGDEGGLLKLFENSITSKDLALNWILKTIKEAINDESNLNELTNQTENYILKSRRRIEDRNNRTILKEYTSDISEFSMEVKNLEKIQREVEKSKFNLFDLGYTLEEHAKAEEFALSDLNKENMKIDENLHELTLHNISHRYYKVEAEKENLLREKQELLKNIEEKSGLLKEKKNLLTSLKVASIIENKKVAEKELAEYKAKIDKLSMKEKDLDVELRDIGYSINMFYKGSGTKLNDEIDRIRLSLKECNSEIEIHNKTLHHHNEKFNTLSEEVIGFKSRINGLSENIEEILAKVENANLFFRTNEDEIENEIVSIKDAELKMDLDIKNNINKIAGINEDIKLKDREIDIIKNEIDKVNSELVLKEKELEAYIANCSYINEKLQKYNFTDSLKNKGIIINSLNKNATELELHINKMMDEKSRIKFQIEKLTSGGLSVNKSFLKHLEDRNIEYYLGANYIKDNYVNEANRKEIINRIPILPYAIILKKDDIYKIKDNALDEYFDTVSILIEKEKIDLISFQDHSGVLELSKGISAVALFNNDSIIKDNLEEDRNNLIENLNIVEDKLKKWKQQLNEIIIFINKVEDTYYDEEYEVQLKDKINSLRENLNQLIDKLKKNNSYKEELKDQLDLLKNQNADLKNSMIKHQVKRNYLEDLKIKVLRKKEAYEKLQSAEDDLKVHENLILHEKSKVKSLERNLLDYKTDEMKISNEIHKLKEKHREFLIYSEGQIKEGEIESLISRYYSLRVKNDDGNIEEYKLKISQCIETIKKCELRMESFNELKYNSITYDFRLEEAAEKERDELNDEINNLSQKEAVLNREVKLKDDNMTALIHKLTPNKLKKKSELEVNLEEKEKALLNRKEVIKISIDNIKNVINDCLRVFNRICDNDWFDLKEYNNSNRAYKDDLIKLKDEIYNEELKVLKSLHEKETKQKEKIKNEFVDLCSKYLYKNQTIDISLNTIEKEINKGINYHLSILIDKQVNLINITLKKLTTDLEILDTEQSQLISNYLDIAKQYTDEMLKIDKNSVLTIENTRKKMMIIDKLNYDEISSPRMLSLFIEEILDSLINNKDLESTNIIKAINKELSIENLLEHYCDLNSIVIKFYKVEENISNSDYKKWEEMLPDNSGGEKFVSFFVLLATLINYSRGNYLKKEVSSMSIIMDNPFAAISSQHLLIPVFEYAKQNNIQLICFSDHDKVDIVERFNTIIRLAITPLTNSKEVVEAEVVGNKAYEEKIDDGYYSYSEQMTLL